MAERRLAAMYGLENKRLHGIIVQQLFRINHLEELLDQARELHREAEKSAREILEEEIKDDRVNFGKAKEKWFFCKSSRRRERRSCGKDCHLNEQWKGATRQFGKKRKESEEAMRELIEKVEKLENELMQKRKKISEMLAASQNEETDLNKLREEHEQEIGKVRKEVVRLQGLLEDVEEENGRMKNAIESLKEDKKTQGKSKKNLQYRSI
ncbi:Protein CBG26190 [Caenorhabditis briggsae]|uniref:Protein CBG26190 n=1 Tax=Caenorhabditis briggsae TaxID=6238 RepID=B6ILT5_CAEBR|nr:Protein CBG26190 [Caenorhabditis briggsae]CAS00865.1 Protein CBG26190 [Caenorhabditis briggsae]